MVTGFATKDQRTVFGFGVVGMDESLGCVCGKACYDFLRMCFNYLGEVFLRWEALLVGPCDDFRASLPVVERSQ